METKLKCKQSGLTHKFTMIEYEGDILIVANGRAVAKLSAITCIEEDDGCESFIEDSYDISFEPLVDARSSVEGNVTVFKKD
jgi:hypothetical protein